MTPIRALVLSPDFPPARGGIQILGHQVVRHFSRVTCEVVTIESDGSDAFDALQTFPVRRVPARPSRSLAVLRFNALGFKRAIEARPDVILSVHIIAGPAAVAAQRLLGVPFAQYVHAKEVGARPRLASYALRNADRAIVVSEYSRQLALDAGAQKDRIRLVHPGVVIPEIIDRRPAAVPTILTIARLEDRYKGHDTLMRAMPLIRARVPDVQWIVIGDGPLRRPLEDMAASVGVADRVHFLGSVSDDERDEWLSRAHVLVMTSRLPAQGLAGEGFGIVYLEANSYGLPVVGGNVGGAVDAIRDGETGLLVDPTNALELAAAVTLLLNDPAEAARLGAQGQERAADFAWPKVSARVEDVLLDIARKRG